MMKNKQYKIIQSERSHKFFFIKEKAAPIFEAAFYYSRNTKKSL